MHKKVAVIGSGFSGISASAYLGKMGYEVHVFEKHDQPGGRARQFKTDSGFTFDMGPSWYWMPDIIENFFNDFGYKSKDFYELVALNPQFEMIFADAKLNVPQSYEELKNVFESLEKGSAKKLDAFMLDAKYKYQVGMQEFVNKPSINWLEYVSPKIAKSALKLDLLSNFRDFVAKYFKNKKLQVLMEFPVIFLGASPKNIPALYSLMNYGGYALGTFYPQGGFYQLVLAMKKIAEENGVKFHFNQNVTEIKVENKRATAIKVNNTELFFDYIVGSSDYHHTETLLEKKYRNYTESYWSSKTFAPSCLIYYIGINQKIPKLKHHTLFFENELDNHIDTIYTNKKWPEKPLFYVCCPSKTDPNVAPKENENLFFLMPLAIGLNDTEETREKYFNLMISRLENLTKVSDLKSKIIYKKSYCVSDFISDYNAYGGNAYGLANTLKQTAVLKPKIINKKVKNLYYTGQLTVPGPGVPPSIISGKIVANQIYKQK
ncbi:phytoene desaturase [Flavobacterium agricola]|uniref:Phytoene desaturase n=1 Tax=Flavobacterium agricola TaxID=2870839 RepID=A0ABY6M3M9_9FLAO|nr:phytoene desaturase family protein [Flavobacterium agricola]UYW02475.1 phytoene desaturase [Flavobacterium agricola]